MPEYLAPGVYVEETSFRSKSIEGVSTTTTGFIGPCRYGPVKETPDIITSLGAFERVYGDGEKLSFVADGESDNYMWHAARAFFEEGGRRLYVSRVFRSHTDDKPYSGFDATLSDPPSSHGYGDGHARATKGAVRFRAKYSGKKGNLSIEITLRASANVFGSVLNNGQRRPTIGALKERDIVWIRATTASPPHQAGDFWIAEKDDEVSLEPGSPSEPSYWRFRGSVGSPISSPLETWKLPPDVLPSEQPGDGVSIRVLTLTVSVYWPNGDPAGNWSGIAMDHNHLTSGLRDSLVDVFSDTPVSGNLPIVVESTANNGLEVLEALFGGEPNLDDGDALLKGLVVPIDLNGGNDGKAPGATEYEGVDKDDLNYKTGLKQFEDLEDISIVAAPGSTWNYAGPRQNDANTIIGLLLSHAQKMRYRIAVLDCAEKQSIAEVRNMRARLDSKYGALYYPWVTILDPITRTVKHLPPKKTQFRILS